jgi:hypothetical protein
MQTNHHRRTATQLPVRVRTQRSYRFDAAIGTRWAESSALLHAELEPRRFGVLARSLLSITLTIQPERKYAPTSSWLPSPTKARSWLPPGRQCCLSRGAAAGQREPLGFVRREQRHPGQNGVAPWLLCEPSRRAGASHRVGAHGRMRQRATTERIICSRANIRAVANAAPRLLGPRHWLSDAAQA